MKSNYKRIGDFVREVKTRNVELKATTLLGINIDKYFMPSVANIVGTDMAAYKIVKKNWFACNRMHVGRDYRLPVALSKSDEDFMVSPAYDVFEITNTNTLLPEYLMMWFSRKEFDRNAWFYTDADVRGGLPWKSFCEMELPVPSINKQKEIVAEYSVIVNRINLNNQLIQKLEETAQTIYKQWFVDFEFPDENGKPYKSCGGKMVESELGEIPKGWKVGRFGDFIDVINGYAFASNDFKEIGDYPILKIGNIDSPKINLKNAQYYSGPINPSIKNCMIESGDILISMTGSHMNQMSSAVGKVGRYNYKIISLLNQRVSKLKPKDNIRCEEYIYYSISKEEIQKELLTGATGSANQANISPNQIKSLPILIASLNTAEEFEFNIGIINDEIIFNQNISKSLSSLKELLLSNLATIEN